MVPLRVRQQHLREFAARRAVYALDAPQCFELRKRFSSLFAADSARLFLRCAQALQFLLHRARNQQRPLQKSRAADGSNAPVNQHGFVQQFRFRRLDFPVRQSNLLVPFGAEALEHPFEIRRAANPQRHTQNAEYHEQNRAHRHGKHARAHEHHQL